MGHFFICRQNTYLNPPPARLPHQPSFPCHPNCQPTFPRLSQLHPHLGISFSSLFKIPTNSLSKPNISACPSSSCPSTFLRFLVDDSCTGDAGHFLVDVVDPLTLFVALSPSVFWSSPTLFSSPSSLRSACFLFVAFSLLIRLR